MLFREKFFAGTVAVLPLVVEFFERADVDGDVLEG
jgi:hypothetical protein